MLHADGCVACSCDFLDSSPLGEVPEHWHMSEEMFEQVKRLAPDYEAV